MRRRAADDLQGERDLAVTGLGAVDLFAAQLGIQ